jgi:hypothetical protein
MCGAGEAYRRAPAFNVTRLVGITTTLIGAIGTGGKDADLVDVARGDSSFWRGEPLDAFARESGTGTDHLRLVIGESAILGAVIMGDQALSVPLARLVRERTDIRAVRARLLAAAPAELASLIARLAESGAEHVEAAYAAA